MTQEATPPKRRAAVCHAQQAAEKALKAYLTFRDQPFDLTHRLPLLIDVCAGLDPRFGEWREVAELLTPYATRFRYPGPPGTPQVPDADEVDEAIHRSRSLFAFVLTCVPAQARPDVA